MKRTTLLRIATSVLVVAFALWPWVHAYAAEAEADPGGQSFQASVLQLKSSDAKKAERTIMLYLCGSDLETRYDSASYNLHQILQASFSKSEDVRFIVMTGGSKEWHLESSYLRGSDGGQLDGISTEYNQVWEAKGADAAQNPGKLVLLDADGVTGDGDAAKKSEEELMSTPATLKAFINYCAQNFPAEHYDLILWDHGAGQVGGFGLDENDPSGSADLMSTAGLMDAFGDNAVTKDGGTFDTINFDACLMGSVEDALLFADYADCYIASPEIIATYGQPYTHWLGVVAEDPDMDAYVLGKLIVDDFIAFYDKTEGEGAGERATLTAINSKELLASGIVDVLSRITRTLAQQVETKTDDEYTFYDELRAARNAIPYSRAKSVCDLGNFVSGLGVDVYEAKQDGTTGDFALTNVYTNDALEMAKILGNKDIIYAKGTADVTTEPQIHLAADGSVVYEPFCTSGLSIAFASTYDYTARRNYVKQMTEVLGSLPDTDARKALLADFLKVGCEYHIVAYTGNQITAILDKGTEAGELKSFADVKARIPGIDDPFIALWNRDMADAVEYLGGEDAIRAWIDEIVTQQVAEAPLTKNTNLKTVRRPDGTGSQVGITDTNKRVLASADETAFLNMIARQNYIDSLDRGDPEYMIAMVYAPSKDDMTIDVVSGELSYGYGASSDGGEDFVASYLDWLHDNTCAWDFDPLQNKWYAIQDAQGNLHAAYIEAGTSDTEKIATAVEVVQDENWQSKAQFYRLVFKGEAGSDTYTLANLLPVYDSGASRPVPAQSVEGNLTLMSSQRIGRQGMSVDLPISTSTFTITGDTAQDVKLVYTSVDDINDLGGNGEKITAHYVVQDIYGARVNVPQEVAGELISIKFATTEPAVYNGAEQQPRLIVTLDGQTKTLVEGVDYIVAKMNTGDVFKNVGSYEIVVEGIGDYTSAMLATFTIVPADIGDADLSGIADATYTGQPITQDLVLEFAGTTLVEGVDYTVSYVDNVEVGTATVTISGMGNFTGTATKTFAIKKRENQLEPDSGQGGQQETPAAVQQPVKQATPNTAQQPVSQSSSKAAQQATPRTSDALAPAIAAAMLAAVAGMVFAATAHHFIRRDRHKR